MKRTAKWQKHLTINELKHVKENGTLSLASVQANLQHNLHLEHAARCHECVHIGRTLQDAGLIKSPAKASS